jgi:hypothetical protein
MGGLIGEVKGIERTTEGIDITADPGGGATVSAQHFGPSGDDAPPLPGDFAALEDSPGAGGKQISGYHDPNNASKAADGEKRIYARNAAGIVVAEVWLKADGSVEIISTVTGFKTIVNSTGDVLAKAGTPNQVGLTTHVHPTAMGPSGPPTPGT